MHADAMLATANRGGAVARLCGSAVAVAVTFSDASLPLFLRDAPPSGSRQHFPAPGTEFAVMPFRVV